jgi:hypothetical protein
MLHGVHQPPYSNRDPRVVGIDEHPGELGLEEDHRVANRSRVERGRLARNGIPLRVHRLDGLIADRALKTEKGVRLTIVAPSALRRPVGAPGSTVSWFPSAHIFNHAGISGSGR